MTEKIACRFCEQPFRPPRCDALFCSGRCKMAEFRRRNAAAVTAAAAAEQAAMLKILDQAIETSRRIVAKRPRDRDRQSLLACVIAKRDAVAAGQLKGETP